MRKGNKLMMFGVVLVSLWCVGPRSPAQPDTNGTNRDIWIELQIVAIRANQQGTKLKSMLTPRVSVLNGQEGRVRFKSKAGHVALETKPSIKDGGVVHVSLKLEFSLNVGGEAVSGEVESALDINDGETKVIAGQVGKSGKADIETLVVVSPRITHGK